MRSKLLKRCWVRSTLSLIVGLAAGPSAFALGISPDGPNVAANDSAGKISVYYLSTLYTGTVAPGYPKFDFTQSATVITFTISGADVTATGGYLYAYAENVAGTSFYPAVIQGCSGLPLVASSASATLSGCNYGTVANFQITISLFDICNSADHLNIRGCTVGAATVDEGDPGNTGTPTTTISGFALHFVTAANTSPTVPTTTTPGAPLQIFPERLGPVVLPANFPAAPGFFPGDQAIVVNTSTMTATPAVPTGSSTNYVTNWVIAAATPATVPARPNEFSATSTIQQQVGYATSDVEVPGFTNTPSTADRHFYDMKIGVQDSAGAVTFSNAYNPVFASEIQGFLRESNCFVATASFRNGRAPGVMLLRHFRDKVLSHYDLGRGFIAWYYANGPIAADWLIEHPIFRSVSLMLLLPLQGVAWITLHPAALWVPLFGLFLLFGFLFLRLTRLKIGESGTAAAFFLITLLLASPPKALATDQPYIDSLISELPKETQPTAEHPDPYIQSIKQKIGKGGDATGYTEEMKKQIGKDGSDGYTDRIQKTLPKTTGSAIEDYRNGKKLHPNKGSLDTRSAFGFNIMASSTRTYASGKNADLAYSDVYGNGWVPDFTFHYEWRPFTSGFIKKFGLYSSLGTSFNKAQGIFNFTNGGQFDARSKTQFQFIALPVNVGLIYRFSLFDFMWPYFGAGPSAIGFIETRNDKQKGHHGYDLGYWFLGGIAFGLDWISPKSSWDQYESTGVKHSYFTVDYSYLESVGGGLVEFTVDGVQLGFTFEL